MALRTWLLFLAGTLAILGAPTHDPVFDSPGLPTAMPAPPPPDVPAFVETQPAIPDSLVAVPEPGTFVLVGGCGLLGLAWRRRRARKTLLFQEFPENFAPRR